MVTSLVSSPELDKGFFVSFIACIKKNTSKLIFEKKTDLLTEEKSEVET